MEASEYVKKLKGQAYDKIVETKAANGDLTTRDKQVIAAAESIIAIGSQHTDLDGFEAFTNNVHTVTDKNAEGKVLTYGNLKGGAFEAQREAARIKASPEYAQATANAKRAEDSKSK